MKIFIYCWWFALCAGAAVPALAMNMPPQVALAVEARKFLVQHEAGFRLKVVCEKPKTKKSKPVCTKELGQFNILLAVKRGAEPFKVITVDGLTCMSKTEGFATFCHTRKGKTNGVNTKFEVSAPLGYQVFALRRAIGGEGGYHEVVYTPFVDSLNTPEVRLYGKHYLDTLLHTAYQDLAKRKVRSLVGKDAYVHERVPQEVISQLVVIEHIDHDRFVEEPISDLVKEVYTTVGLNLGLSYNYAKSTAGARGLLQVIPATYGGMLRVYPKAGLIPDFTFGMTNHHNAVKAAILLADHDVGIIPQVSTRSWLLSSSNRTKYADYISSAYNAGPALAKRLLVSGKDHVHDNPNPENKIYVAKRRAVASTSLHKVLAVQ